MLCMRRNVYVVITMFDTSAGERLFPEGIISTVVNISALTWFHRCIYYQHLLCLTNLNIIKTKMLPKGQP